MTFFPDSLKRRQEFLRKLDPVQNTPLNELQDKLEELEQDLADKIVEEAKVENTEAVQPEAAKVEVEEAPAVETAPVEEEAPKKKRGRRKKEEETQEVVEETSSEGTPAEGTKEEVAPQEDTQAVQAEASVDQPKEE